MSGKKINPRRVARTESDVKKAESAGIDLGVKRAIKMALYILIDKHDAPAEDVQELFDEMAWLAKAIESGGISWGDVDRVLKEYDIKINWR